MPSKRTISVLLGCCLWVAALGMLASSVYTVRARVARPVRLLEVEVSADSGLAAGDSVFLSTKAGLQRIGEVSQVDGSDRIVSLAIQPAAFDGLSASTRVTCWRTPLSAEAAINAMLPEAVQQKIAERIAEDWRTHREAVSAAWSPIAGELATSYLRLVRGDIQAAFRGREEELWEVAKTHGRSVVDRWPAIQERLRPILREHLTPVLGRLMDEALGDAPKVSIAWNVALGDNREAFRRTLDWLADYLAQMSDADRAELSEAVRLTWETARDDPVLAAEFDELGEGIIEDQRLWSLVTEIYHEAIANNPRTGEFLRSEVLESPRVRKEVYELVETLAPTARSVLAICLFDDQGATRPEAVHLVRSSALGRNVAWVTIHSTETDGSRLEPGARLRAEVGGLEQ